MEIRQLEYFKIICNLNSFSQAAQKLHITQPTITVAIKKLEEELGVELFKRSNKGTTLTKQGEVFCDRVEEILNLLENTNLEMREYKQNKKEVIKVGIPPIIGHYIYSEMFATYKRNNPNIELEICERGSAEVVRLLEEDELDVGIIILEHSSSLIETKKIKQEEILVCFSHSSELNKLKEIGFESLKNEDYIFAKDGTYIKRKILAQCEKNNFEPNVIFNGAQIITIMEMVANSIGIAFITEYMATKNKNIISKSLEEPVYIDIGVAKRKSKYLSKRKREFLEFLSSI